MKPWLGNGFHIDEPFYGTPLPIIGGFPSQKDTVTLWRHCNFYHARTQPVDITEIMQSWWRLQMETFSALLAICAGNSPVPGEFPAQKQWRGALMFSLICVWINGWVNNCGDLRRYRTHCDVTVMGMLCVTALYVIVKSASNLSNNKVPSYFSSLHKKVSQKRFVLKTQSSRLQKNEPDETIIGKCSL